MATSIGEIDKLLRIKDPAERIKALRAAGQDTLANMVEFRQGAQSTGIGLITGIPDLVIEGYNYATGNQMPTLRQRALEAMGAPTGPTTPEGSTAYNAPEVGALAYGLLNLGKLGVKGIKQFFSDKKVKKVLDTLDETDLGVLRKYAVKGQGGESRELMNVLEKLSYSDKYGEIISALRSGATTEAIKGMAPSASKISEAKAATSAAQAVGFRLDKLKEAKDLAGSLAFEKAFGYAGGQRIVDIENTLTKIRSLRSEFAKGNTSSSDAAAKFLEDLEQRLVPTGTAPSYAGTSVVRKGEPTRTIPSTAGTTVVRAGEPTRAIPSYPGKAVTETITTMERDATGMLRPVTRERAASVPGTTGYTIPGTPDVTMNIPGSAGYIIPGTPDVTMSIPGSAGYTFSYGSKVGPLGEPIQATTSKQTLESVQSMLTQFGKEASSGTGLIKDVTLTDQQRIAAAVFGGLKDDLRVSAKLANSAGDLNAQRGIEAMMKGRDQVSQAYGAYNDVLNQRIPSWLKDKQLSEVGFDDMLKHYTSASPEQRVAFREMVGSTDAEALKAIDNRVWDDFIRDAKVERPDGTFGIDLGAMSRNWFNLMQKGDRNAADALATSLGTNAAEFSTRMSDALKFTRSMQTSPTQKPVIDPKLGSALEAVVGSSLGYQPAKGVAVVRAAVNEVGSKFTLNGMDEDFLMKVLLTPEGKDFLKTANLSKNAQKTLMDLDKVQRITKEQFVAPVMSFSAPVSRVLAPETAQPEQQQEPQIDLSGLGGTAAEPEIDLSGLGEAQPTMNAPVNPTIQLDGLINRLQPQQ